MKPSSTEIDLAEAKDAGWDCRSMNKSLAESLRKMRFDTKKKKKKTDQKKAGASRPGNSNGGKYPAYRTDIRHMVDLFEDVAIGYGYGNIEPRLVRSMTVGAPRREEILSDRVRQILIGLGYSEIMSLPLTTEEHQFERLRLPTPERLRRGHESEAQGVQRRPRAPAWAASSKRSARTAAARCRSGCSKSTTSSSSTNRPRRVRPNIARWRSPRSAARAASPRPAAWSTRCCASWVGKPNTRRSTTRRSSPAGPRRVFVAGQTIGVLGEVHPEVLSNFGLTYPVALAELTLERVC